MPPGNICCNSKEPVDNVTSFTLPNTMKKEPPIVSPEARLSKDSSVPTTNAPSQNSHLAKAESTVASPNSQPSLETSVAVQNSNSNTDSSVAVPESIVKSSSNTQPTTESLTTSDHVASFVTDTPEISDSSVGLSDSTSDDRVRNLEAILTNMLTCGVLTEYVYRSSGSLLVQVWRATITEQPVKVYRYGFECDGGISFNKMPLQLTKPAPQWKTTAVVNGEFKDISLSDYKGKYVVLFFYPLDFTFVCPTEIIAFSERADEFRKIGCEVIAASTDSHFTHLAWINTPRKHGGLGPMNIPIISDKSHRIARDYGVLDEETGIPFRGLFIVDDQQRLRQITVNDLPVGRSVDETLRLVQAFQYTDKYGEVCPANWTPGSKTIKPDTKAAKEYFGDAN